jgi:four helix bundle protein
MGVVEEEADETIFWMDLLIEAHIVAEEELKALMKEADEILAIIVSSIKTARKR